MSYILDALRKADAQRERDPARGIHAQALPPSALARPDGRGLPAWAIPAAGVAIVLVAFGGWWAMRSHVPAAAPAQVTAPAVQVAPPPQQTAVLAPPVPAPAAGPAPAPAMPSPPPMVAAAPPAAPRQLTIQEMNRSVPPMRGTPATPGVDPNRARLALAQATPPVGAGPAAARPAAPAPANAGLPADAPKVSISGGVYSTDPTQRMLIVNGQVFNEGSELAPGVRLAEIKARTAILEFRGARYSVAY